MIDKFLELHTLSKSEYLELLQCWENEEVVNRLKTEAVRLRKQYYGDKVFTRGLIEFTNYCKNNCYYCGIRNGNRHVDRYRLTEDEILECCQTGYELGYHTFVLQGGEDPYYHDERMEQIIRAIKGNFPDCALTLSLGEKSYESYRRFREAGADRYLLPATTALGTMDPRGREKGLEAGANVVMPNLSPVKNRKLYELYDNKICTGEEAAECRGCLGRRVASAGYRLVEDRGDALA